MTELNIPAGYTDGDVDTNNTNNPHLWTIAQERYSRRETMTGLGAACMAFLGSSVLAGCDGGSNDAPLTPIAGNVSAGADITTSSGRAVSLQGTLSNASTVGFEQVSGPTVTIANANTPNASFIAPSVNAQTELVFRFRGTAANGGALTDEVVVSVGPAQLSFGSLAKNLADVVTVPAGYSVTVLYRGGDPILPNTPAFANDGSDTNWGRRAGDHHDGMYYYGLAATGNGRDLSNNQRGLLVMNHENINQQYLHPAGATAPGGIRPAAEAIKEIEAHGVSVVEVTRAGASGTWSYTPTSALNRRITPNTPVEFSGPARGNALLRTLNGPTGTTGRGTINNCAFGFFLWGTFMTCEENWASYFRRPASDDANRSPRELTSLRRYGIGGNGNYGWATVTAADATAQSLDPAIFARWNAAVDTTKPADGTGDYRYEPWQFGWCVEFDPYDPAGVIKKRTALGRMGHEGAWHGSFRNGQRFAVYLGDDARGEYFYKFVSTAVFDSADNARQDRMAVSDKYFDSGTLYAARFNADGTGAWIPLTFGQVPDRPATGSDPVYVFADQADILFNTRLAADAVGATRMDRPEWTATDNRTGEIYLTLTNNRSTEMLRDRPGTGTDPANPRFYNDPRGTSNQLGNPNGHILRLRENGDDNAALAFTWDIYLFGADSADANAANVNLSALDASNDFSSPDGAWFSRPTNPAGAGNRQLLWIQTDDGAFTDRTNNQMLAALPGNTRDGGQRTVTNSNGTQTTQVGAAATPATLRRFMIGPKECELTGVDSTPDGRTLFVNIQHPGENGTPAAPSSNWPQSQATGTGTGRPRSATVVITKDDGGVVGL